MIKRIWHKFTNWLRAKLRAWLLSDLVQDMETTRKLISSHNIDIREIKAWISEQTQLAVDVSFNGHDQTHIVLISRLNNGRVQIFPAQFKNLVELNDFCRYLRDRYKAYAEPVFDVGPYNRDMGKYLGDWHNEQRKDWRG